MCAFLLHDKKNYKEKKNLKNPLMPPPSVSALDWIAEICKNFIHSIPRFSLYLGSFSDHLPCTPREEGEM